MKGHVLDGYSFAGELAKSPLVLSAVDIDTEELAVTFGKLMTSALQVPDFYVGILDGDMKIACGICSETGQPYLFGMTIGKHRNAKSVGVWGTGPSTMSGRAEARPGPETLNLVLEQTIEEYNTRLSTL